MHLNNPRPDLGEIITPEEEKEGHGSHRDRQRDRDERGAAGDHLCEQHTVALAKPIEAALEPPLKAEEDIPRWFRARLAVMVMRLRHGGPSSYISPWSAPACATGRRRRA